MSVLVADHSTGGARIGSVLKSAAVRGVIRYAAAGRTSANITAGEVKDLKDHDIAIGIVNEHESDYLLGGHAVGKQRAREAQQIALDCGLPAGVVYMAGDFDATLGGLTHPGSTGEANMKKILAALEGAAESVGKDNVGFYGSYFAVDYLIHHAMWIKHYWQTSAWSAKLLHPTADMYQGNPVSRQPTSQTIGGVNCDTNVALVSDWGQRTQRPVNPHPAGHFNADLSLLANTGEWDLKPTKSVDVHFGQDDQLDVIAIGVYVGGPKKGQWVKKPMPKNWKPPGGWPR